MTQREAEKAVQPITTEKEEKEPVSEDFARLLKKPVGAASEDFQALVTKEVEKPVEKPKLPGIYVHPWLLNEGRFIYGDVDNRVGMTESSMAPPRVIRRTLCRICLKEDCQQGPFMEVDYEY